MSMPKTGALKEYFDWEIKSWVDIEVDFLADRRERFLPIDAARSYFETTDDGKRRNLDKILSEMFNMEFHLIDSDSILRDYTAVFCILLSIGRGSYIEHFACFEELSDQRLPFDLLQPPRYFPIEDDSTFLTDFCNAQNRYCVPIFDSHMLHRHFGNQRLLPIIFKKQLPTKNMVKSHIIQLYGPYNKMTRLKDKEKMPHSDTYFIKSYSEAVGLGSYTREINALRSIKDSDSIIKFYGSFELRGEAHILLEFADKGTLHQFFRNEAPPSRGGDIIDFWENILKLINGLRAIHSIKDHFNISSESILVLSYGKKSPSDWQFKFSDTGLLSEWRSNSKNSDQTHEKIQYQNTRPAFCADLWQLGYVFSQAALWVADGYKGIIDFQKQLGEVIEPKKNYYTYGEDRVSERIIDAHPEIENRLRRSDYITKDILALLDEEMLCDKGNPDFEALIQRSINIISKARLTLIDVNSNYKASRRQSQCRNSLWPVSPHPPLPILADEYKSEISPSRSNFALFPENRELPDGARPFLKRASTFSAYGNNFSHMRNISSNGNTSSIGRETPESEYKTLATSWFIESPTTDTSNTPPTSSEVSIRRCHSQSPEINKPLEMALCSNTGRRVDSNSSINITFIRDTPKSKQPYVAQLRGALNTLPSQESSLEYRSFHISPSNSVSKTTHVEDTGPKRPLSHSSNSRRDQLGSRRSLSLNNDTSNESPHPRPHTSVCSKLKHDSHHPSLQKKNHEKSLKLSENLPSSLPTEDSMNSAKYARKSFMHPPSNPSLIKSYNLPGIQSSITQKGRRLSSALNSKRSSIFPMFGNNVPSANNFPVLPTPLDPINAFPTFDNIAFLDIDTCNKWKQLRKATKKKSHVPLLPGMHRLQSLQERDHVFIVDDSNSMAPYWADVIKVFSALSYIVKSTSNHSIELLFTISSEIRRRRGTHDLCNYLSAKALQECQTNISERLNKQLIAHRLKLINSRNDVKKPNPISFYIFSNGLWLQDSENLLGGTLEQIDTILTQFGLKNQVFISFIGFENNFSVAERVRALNRSDWQDHIIIKWNLWTSNVWEMLRGDLPETNNFQDGNSSGKPCILAKDIEKKSTYGYDYRTSICEDQIKRKMSANELRGVFELAS